METFARFFFVINKLIESEHTIEQLRQKFFDEYKLYKVPSRHAFDKDIERLIKSGFLLEENLLGNSKSYKITQTPLNYTLTNIEKELLKEVFETYSNNSIGLERFFEKIGTLLHFQIKDLIPIQDISNFKNKEIYLQVKNQLQKAISGYYGDVRKVSFEYVSVTAPEPKTWNVFPYKIDCDKKRTERVYIYGDSSNLPKYLNLERIISVPVIHEESISKDEVFKNHEFATFRLYPPVSKSYHLSFDEKQISEDIEKDSIVIKTPFYTPFDLCQKLLKYGQFAEIIEPVKAIEEMKKIIKNMNNRYS